MTFCPPPQSFSKFITDTDPSHPSFSLPLPPSSSSPYSHPHPLSQTHLPPTIVFPPHPSTPHDVSFLNLSLSSQIDLQAFHRERVLPRVVHARGSGAHGVFHPNGEGKKFFRNSIMSRGNGENHNETPLFIRFSNAISDVGTPDTKRDVRGFSVKFYTSSGIWDLVGNHLPVFPIQRGEAFPSFVHSARPSPHHQMPSASSAQERFWDFLSFHEESTMFALYLMSDRGTPRSYRHMEGFGVNTFITVNEQGQRFWVKFHLIPMGGVRNLLWEESNELMGVDPDFHRRDLWDSIQRGHFPQWQLGMQCVKEEDAMSMDFSMLDVTKMIPEEMIPIVNVGTITLNRNANEFNPSVDQVAFCPSNLIDGMELSSDPMLRLRAFSYRDAQLYRLGSPNYRALDINNMNNKGKNPIVCPYRSMSSVVSEDQVKRDGPFRTISHPSPFNYLPNITHPVKTMTERGAEMREMKMEIPINMDLMENSQRGKEGEKESEKGKESEGKSAEKMKAEKEIIRSMSEPPFVSIPSTEWVKFLDHFSLPRLFWHSLTDEERLHIIQNFQFDFAHIHHPLIIQRWVNILNHVDHSLAKAVAEATGVNTPIPLSSSEYHNDHMGSFPKNCPSLSPTLSNMNKLIASKGRSDLRSTRVAVVVGEGYDVSQVMEVAEALEKEGINVELVGPHIGDVANLNSNNGNMKGKVTEEGKSTDMETDSAVPSTTIVVRHTYWSCKSILFDGVIIVGQGKSVEKMSTVGQNFCFIAQSIKHCKPILAMGDAVEIFRNDKYLHFNSMFPKGIISNDEKSQNYEGIITQREEDFHNNVRWKLSLDSFLMEMATGRHFSRKVKMCRA